MGDRGSEFSYQFTCFFISVSDFDIDIYFIVFIWIDVMHDLHVCNVTNTINIVILL